jgi:PPIC-type PPIASE domain
MKTMISRLLREPLIHFLVFGGLMFAVYYAMNPSASAPPPNVITITPKSIERIRAGFTGVWKREPSEDELNSLIDDAVREEIYYREAVKLGLDQGDALVKRRMRLKMEFLMDSASSVLEPTGTELEDFYTANVENYLEEQRVAFEQVYLGEEVAATTVDAILTQLRSDPQTDLYSIGPRSQLPAQLGLSTNDAVTGVFGRGFFESVVALEPKAWTGPVISTYGVHVVRVLENRPAQAPKLAEVRGLVLRDWRTAKRGEIQDRDYATRRARYVVEIDRGNGAQVVMQ